MLKPKLLAVAVILVAYFLPNNLLFAQQAASEKKATAKQAKRDTKTLYGQASFYSQKFEGRKTASGQLFNHKKFTAACNTLPLGTFIKVTNLKNGKTVIVQTNDRLHKKTTRLIDLTMAGAKRLGFVSAGLTRVKIEVLGGKKDKIDTKNNSAQLYKLPTN